MVAGIQLLLRVKVAVSAAEAAAPKAVQKAAYTSKKGCSGPGERGWEGVISGACDIFFGGEFWRE